MVRKVFKNNNSQKNSKIEAFIKKYNIPREYLSTNRKSVARGLLVGLFWAFIPMPLQMVAVVACTPFIKFNVPLAIAMVWLSNPLTMPLMYYIEYLTGSFILGHEPLNVELSISWFKEHWERIFIPLYLGSAVYSVGVSSLAYYLVDHLWIRSVKYEKSQQKRKDIKAKKNQD